MWREMLQAKLHNGVVTDCHLEYSGSLTVDLDLIECAGMLVHQKVQLLDLTNGARLETYLIPGERGGREIVVNGAAARLVDPGNRVIVISYALYDDAELTTYRPKVLILDEGNEVVREL